MIYAAAASPPSSLAIGPVTPAVGPRTPAFAVLFSAVPAEGEMLATPTNGATQANPAVSPPTGIDIPFAATTQVPMSASSAAPALVIDRQADAEPGTGLPSVDDIPLPASISEAVSPPIPNGASEAIVSPTTRHQFVADKSADLDPPVRATTIGKRAASTTALTPLRFVAAEPDGHPDEPAKIDDTVADIALTRPNTGSPVVTPFVATVPPAAIVASPIVTARAEPARGVSAASSAPLPPASPLARPVMTYRARPSIDPTPAMPAPLAVAAASPAIATAPVVDPLSVQLPLARSDPSQPASLVGPASATPVPVIPLSAPVQVVAPAIVPAAPLPIAGPTVALTAPPPVAPSTVAAPPPVGTAGPALQVFHAAIAAASQREEGRDPAPAADLALVQVSAPVPATQVAAIGDAQQAPLDLTHQRWPHAMIDRIELLRDAADATDTRIRLIPDALGSIDVSIKRDGATLHVHFAAEQAATRTLIQDAQPRLAAIAQERGLTLGQGTVDAGTGGRPQPHTQTANVPRTPAPATTDLDDEPAAGGRLA